jgi:hypothetical protein
MNYDIASLDHAVQFILGMGALLGFTGVPAMLWWLTRRFPTRAEVAQVQRALESHQSDHDKIHEGLNRRLADGEREFAEIKTSLAHLPDHHDLDDLKDRISAVESQVGAIGGKMDGLRTSIMGVENRLDILLQHHLKRA